MREIFIEESKQIQLGILKNFIAFCNQNRLTYFIAYGTLIGAIRHHGFIPWDDDIDVQMPRADYEKLIKTFNRQQTSDRFFLVSPYDKNAIHSYVKIIDQRTVKIESSVRYHNNAYLGVDIDVFPLDALPDTQEEYDQYYKKVQKIYKKYAYSKTEFSGKDLKSRALKLYQCLLGDGRRLIKKADAERKKCAYDASGYVGTLTSFYDYYNDRHNKEAYEHGVPVLFEGIEVTAPVGYDRVLRDIYGDYMQLPPIEEQKTHHGYTAYWKEEPQDGDR